MLEEAGVPISPEANEALTREIAAMFDVMEPAVAAAALAVQVVEDRVAEGRDRRTAAAFSGADLAVTRELDLSRIFKRLLDPDETHAQGDTFLALLLEELRLAPVAGAKRKSLRAFGSLPAAPSRVLHERSTGPVEMEDGDKKDGRIDILVELADGRRIAIENKPWAWEGPDQIELYLRYLASGDPAPSLDRVLLLYWIGWSGEGSDPDLAGLRPELADRYVKMPYRETNGHPSVEGWLRRCAVACEAPPVRSFVIDLIRFVGRKFQR